MIQKIFFVDYFLYYYNYHKLLPFWIFFSDEWIEDVCSNVWPSSFFHFHMLLLQIFLSVNFFTNKKRIFLKIFSMCIMYGRRLSSKNLGFFSLILAFIMLWRYIVSFLCRKILFPFHQTARDSIHWEYISLISTKKKCKVLQIGGALCDIFFQICYFSSVFTCCQYIWCKSVIYHFGEFSNSSI